MLSIIYRAIIVYLVVIVGIRLMGKRQIGEMQPSELVVTLMISEAAAIPLQDIDQPVMLGIVAIVTLVFLEVLMSVLSLKFSKLNRLVSGSCRIVIRDGVIDQKEMARLRITLADLLELLRDRDVYDISTIAYAIIETNGGISVMLKDGHQPATKNDVEAEKKPAFLPLPVISDGKLMLDALKELNLDKRDILKILNDNGLEEKEVFLLSIDKGKSYTMIKKEEV